MSVTAQKQPRRSFDPDEADRLVSENLNLVYDVARKLTYAGGVGPDRDDLISAGVQGLIQAARSYDPGRGLAFSTLAVTRVRGAMLDEMRRWDPTPRSVRKKERQMKQAEARLWTQLGRRPTPAEMAEELAVSESDLHTWVLDVSRHSAESLDEVRAPKLADRRGLSVLDVVADSGPDAGELLDRQESVDLLKECLATLPERQARVLALYYYEELRLRDIAQLLEVTESRISQIRHGALKKLRMVMKDYALER